jgi:hypothetical protein
MLAALPDEVRDELEAAAESLDSGRVAAAIAKAGE